MFFLFVRCFNWVLCVEIIVIFVMVNMLLVNNRRKRMSSLVEILDIERKSGYVNLSVFLSKFFVSEWKLEKCVIVIFVGGCFNIGVIFEN